MNKIVVDPVNGYRYGFPKVWDKVKYPDFKDWLLKNGYPLQMIEKFPNCRYWEYREESEDLSNNE